MLSVKMVALTDLLNVANLLASISTLIFVIIVYWSTKDSQKTRLGDFLLRLHDSLFYQENNAKIIKCIESNKPVLKKNGGIFSEFELDNFLGSIELLSVFVKENLIKENLVKHIFGYYIVKTGNSKEIKQYVKESRSKNGQIIY